MEIYFEFVFCRSRIVEKWSPYSIKKEQETIMLKSIKWINFKFTQLQISELRSSYELDRKIQSLRKDNGSLNPGKELPLFSPHGLSQSV